MSTLLLDGQPIEPDSLLWWPGGACVIRAADPFGAESALDSYATHLGWMKEFPDRIHKFYSWPDLRQLTEYLNERDSKQD
jgi:hypothetical protein